MCCSYLVEPLPNCAPRRWVSLHVCTRTRMHHHHAETVGSAATEPSGFEHGICQRSGGITKYKRKTLEPDEKDTACTETTIVVPHLSCHRDLSQFATCPPWKQTARRASQSCLDTDCMPCILHHAAVFACADGLRRTEQVQNERRIACQTIVLQISPLCQFRVNSLEQELV